MGLQPPPLLACRVGGGVGVGGVGGGGGLGGRMVWPLAGVVRPDPATQNLTTSQASPQPAISEGQLWCVVADTVS